MEPQVKVFVDSGAYSAAKLGDPINLADYCRYLKDNEEWIHAYAALDVLTPGNPEDGAEQSWRNYQAMRKQGLRPVPVFHYGEDIRWLYSLLDAGCDYIALGGTAILGNKAASRTWYDSTWSHLVNAKGEPVVKVHGFGEGNAELVERYPWHSVDSTTWLFSSIRTPNVMMDTKRKVNVGIANSKAGQVDTMGAADRRIYDEFLAQHGLQHSDLEDDNRIAYTTRGFLATTFYHAWEARVRARREQSPALWRPAGFFNPPPRKEAGIDNTPFRFFLVNGGNMTTWACVTRVEHRAMLCSYYYIKKNTIGMLDHLRDYALDPLGTVRKLPRWNEFYDMLPANPRSKT